MSHIFLMAVEVQDDQWSSAEEISDEIVKNVGQRVDVNRVVVSPLREGDIDFSHIDHSDPRYELSVKHFVGDPNSDWTPAILLPLVDDLDD